MSDGRERKPGGFVRRALAANMVGTLLSAAVAILAVPLYVKFLGIEAYGLIGLFTTLQLSLALLDLGLSSTMTRELARRQARGADAAERADLIRTLELIFAGVAVGVGVLLSVLARPLARDWVNPQALDRDTVEHAFRHMAVAIAAQWPASVYVGALLGLEKQVLLSTIGTVFSTTKALGILLVFWAFGPSVQSFFVWQTVNAAVQVVVMSSVVWRTLPGWFFRARFRVVELKSIWRFAVGNMAIDGTGIVLSQVDKVVLSKFLSLEAFGLFSLVSTVASNISRVVGPVFTVYYPRLAHVVSKGDRVDVRRTYHDGAQILAALVTPICVVIAVFPREVLTVWTGNPAIAAASASLLSVLILGRLVNAVMHLPAALQLANGWTSLALYNNIVSVVLVVPLVVGGVKLFGAMGAAIVWVLLNVGGLLAQVPIMHRRVLPGEMGAWLKDSVLLPAFGALLVAVVLRPFVDGIVGRWVLLVELGAITLACCIGCWLATPNARRWLLGYLARYRTS